MHAAWTQVDEVTWVFTIQADRFLRNMVRAVVGTLLEVGRGKLTVEVSAVLLSRKTGAGLELLFPVMLCSW